MSACYNIIMKLIDNCGSSLAKYLSTSTMLYRIRQGSYSPTCNKINHTQTLAPTAIFTSVWTIILLASSLSQFVITNGLKDLALCLWVKPLRVKCGLRIVTSQSPST